MASVLQLPAWGLIWGSVCAANAVVENANTAEINNFMLRISWVCGELLIRQGRKLWTGIATKAGNLSCECKNLDTDHVVGLDACFCNGPNG